MDKQFDEAERKLVLPDDTKRWRAKLVEFQADLKADTSVVIRKHILEGESMVLDGRNAQNLLARVAERFDVDQREVRIVGSGLLGFSIKPGKRYELFGDASDKVVTIDAVRTNLERVAHAATKSQTAAKRSAALPKREVERRFLQPLI
jgi:hypothetical protein